MVILLKGQGGEFRSKISRGKTQGDFLLGGLDGSPLNCFQAPLLSGDDALISGEKNRGDEQHQMVFCCWGSFLGT